MSAPKQTASDFLDRNAGAIATLGDSVFYFGELGMQEMETSRLMTELLRDGGFRVEAGISGFRTGFCATYGSGGPVLAMHTEYDANPDNSQMPGVLTRSPIIEGAPGHCEGHNVNGAVLVAAALAARGAMETHGLPGTLKVFGAPAEEQLISRPYYVRDGWFDDVDVALAPHIGPEFRVGYGLIQSALISAIFTFHGETAHAGVAPWKGRDALDAVVLMDMGLAQHREHMTPTQRCQRVIINGGDQPNVIPRTAAVWWYFRDASAKGAKGLFDKARRIAEGAAMMTGTDVEVDVQSAVWPVRGNRTAAEVVERNIEAVGMPVWTGEEEDFARAIQTQAGVAADGLKSAYRPMRGPAEQRPAANDAGDISWKVPHAKMYYPSSIPNISYHHWTAGVALTSSIAHKGALAGAKVLAASLIDFLTEPELVQEARRTFAVETEGTSYFSMLPADQKPPTDLNREAMERYRPQMQKHYPTGRPSFVP